MRRHVLFCALPMLILFVSACSTPQTSEQVPPTATPAPTIAPTPTPEGGGVKTGFFVLDLEAKDQEGLEERAEEIYQRLIGSGGEVDREALIDAYKALADYTPVGGAWQAIGPAPIEGVNMPQGQVPGSGRINGIVVDPRNSNVVYLAAAAGGLWKTTDGGKNWRSLTDKQVPLFFNGIVMDPRDPGTLYALLQVFDGLEASKYGYLANGILRTRDGGDTWQLLAAQEFNGAAATALVFDQDGTLYAASGQIRLFIAPDDQPDFGIFKSTDDGDTWERLVSCSDFAACDYETQSGNMIHSGGFMDLDISGEGTLYASVCNVMCEGVHLIRSGDGGETWDELDFGDALQQWVDENGYEIVTVEDIDMPYVDGLELAVAPSDPNVLLAGGGLHLIDPDNEDEPIPWSFAMRSTDGGDTWEWLPDAGDYCTGGGGSPQCTYDNVVEIDPNDADSMYLAGSFSREKKTQNWIAIVRRSDDGGDTWTDMTPSDYEAGWMHPDAHAIAFDPGDTNVVWVGNDGGVYRTLDASAAEPEWENLSRGLNTLLIIGIGLHPTDPDYIIGGLQDNGNAFTTDSGKTWQGASQGDGADAAVDPFEPSIVYSHNPFFCFSRNENGGEGGWQEWFPGDDCYYEGLDSEDNWLFYAPFVVDPNTEGVLYFASNVVYKTEDRADNWEPISDYLTEKAIQSLALAASDSDVLYAGTTDGLVWVTTDGGENWTDVTSNDFPQRNVTDIAVDPTDPQTAYAVFGGFVLQTPDQPGHVFRTTDGGDTWDDLSLNLPDAPLSAAVVDARNDYAGVYVGGALGVWVLQDGSDEWRPYGTGMPFSLITDLELNPDTGIMAAATFGRSVWMMKMP